MYSQKILQAPLTLRLLSFCFPFCYLFPSLPLSTMQYIEGISSCQVFLFHEKFLRISREAKTLRRNAQKHIWQGNEYTGFL